MATRPENLHARTPSLLMETDIPDWSDLSAEQYFSNLTRYLRNITLSLSRPRLSDLISVDKDVGLVWLISIPVAYFVVVAIILTVLLLCFWYVDKSFGVSPAPSEVSVSTSTASSLKEHTHVRSIKHDTMIVNEALNSPYHSSVRSYLINAEFQDILRISDGSKGSTRSLGVLTEKDLQLPYKHSASRVSPDVTPTGRRQSTNIQECPGHLMGLADSKFDSRTFTRVKSSFRTVVRSEVALKTTKESESSRSMSSFSTDSLEEKVSADSLGASMEFHKNVRATGGDIGPGDLYGCPEFVQDSADRGFVQDLPDQGFLKDNNINGKAESKMDRKFIFLNHIFSQNHLQNTDAHLKATYEAALKADKINFYRNSTETRSSSFFPSIHFPGHELSEYHRHEITPFHRAYTLNQENSDEFSESNQEYSVKNMGTNCQKMHFGSYFTKHRNMNEGKENQVKGRLFTADSSTNESQISSVNYTEDDTHSSNDRQRSNHQHDISLASLALSDEHQLTFSSDNYKEDLQAPDDVAGPDFDISNVSQIALTSQEDFDNSQDSFGSGRVRPNEEGSFCSADNSLPSSIARFHASNIGQWSSLCAGYSLPSETDLESSQNECLCKDCPCKQSSRSSLSVNFGSCSDSTTAEIQTALSQGKSRPYLSQNGTDCDLGSGKLEQGLVKLSKRPSPLSSFVNNIRQRYSLDDNCLKSKREVSDEEALLLSPMLQKELGPKFNKQPSLDSKRRKVSVEERLQEYGFLKCKGKKYVINPSPGKYETGSGYYNLVFTNNEDSGTSKYRQDQANKQSEASRFNFPPNGCMGDRSLTGGSEGVLPFSQHPEEFSNDYQFSPFMGDSFYNFSLSRFNQKDEYAVRATCFSLGQESSADFERDAPAVRAPCSDMGQERTSVFEAHNGDDLNFSDIDVTHEDSGNNQIAREITQSASLSFPDQCQVVSNIVSKQNDSLAGSEKRAHKAQLFLREFDYSESKEVQNSDWPKMRIQTGLYEQTEATKCENARNDTHGEKYTYGNNQIGVHVNNHNVTYGNNLHYTCGKHQNGTYEHTQNGTYEHTQNRIYETDQNFLQGVTQRYENDQIDYYENYRNGKHGQVQNGRYEKGQQNVVGKTEPAKKSSSSDFRDTRYIWEQRATREGKCASSVSSVGKASMETEHKLKRQQTSRVLLSLENGSSRLSEIQQDPENGFSELCEIQQDPENGFSELCEIQDPENGFSELCEIQRDRHSNFSGRCEKQLDQDNGFSGRCEKQLDEDNGFSGGDEEQPGRSHSFTVAVDTLQRPESGLHSRSRSYRATKGNLEAQGATGSVRV